MNATPEYGSAVSEEVERLRADRGTLQAQLAAMGRPAGGPVSCVEQPYSFSSALQVGGVLVVVAMLLVFEVSWGWFLAIIALLACWELMLWRLGGGAGADTIPTPAPQ